MQLDGTLSAPGENPGVTVELKGRGSHYTLMVGARFVSVTLSPSEPLFQQMFNRETETTFVQYVSGAHFSYTVKNASRTLQDVFGAAHGDLTHLEYCSLLRAAPIYIYHFLRLTPSAVRNGGCPRVLNLEPFLNYLDLTNGVLYP